MRRIKSKRSDGRRHSLPANQGASLETALITALNIAAQASYRQTAQSAARP
jgi:hypothetical protein